MPLLAKQQKKLNEAHQERLQAERRAEGLKNSILRLQAQEAQLDAALSAVHQAASMPLHAAQQPLPALCKPMTGYSSLSPTACKHVAGKEQRMPGRLQEPNASQSMLHYMKSLKQGNSSTAARHSSKSAGSSSSIKAACPSHRIPTRLTSCCRDANNSHCTLNSSQLPSQKAPVPLAMHSHYTPPQGIIPTHTSSSKGSRKLGTTSDSPGHGVADTNNEPTGSVASGQQHADCLFTVKQVGPHSFQSKTLRPSSSNSTDDCKSAYCTDDQAPQQSLHCTEQNAQGNQPVQATQTSTVSCRARATAQPGVTMRNDIAHEFEQQQGHVLQSQQQQQQQQSQSHEDGPQPSEGLAHQFKVSPPRQVGLRRLAGQASHDGYSGSVNRSGSINTGRTVVRTLSQPGSAAHMMQRLN